MGGRFCAVKDFEEHLERRPELAGLAAVQVAARLEHLGGLLFYDTAGNVPKNWREPVSVVSAMPSAIYRGSIHRKGDRDVLEAALLSGHTGNPKELPFAGGLCGWISYEGDFVFGCYKQFLLLDEQTGEWWEKGELSKRFQDPLGTGASVGAFESHSSRANFVTAVESAKNYISAGDIYQVNLAQKFSAEVSGEGSLFPLYGNLREASPSPMGLYQSLDGREILGTSPEVFLKMDGKRIETRPIKGTRPRFADTERDEISVNDLKSSPKEVSELVMITDLLRNDLGQVCEFGSVEVEELCGLETLAQVHHLVSIVTGELGADEDHLSAMAACFPGGSITGAPKKRAMEIIEELEPCPRDLYCGSMGWFGFQGKSAFNIAIRTLIRSGDLLSYHVGAGIVADSDPEAEYEETMQKGVGIRLAIDAYRQAHTKTI